MLIGKKPEISPSDIHDKQTKTKIGENTMINRMNQKRFSFIYLMRLMSNNKENITNKTIIYWYNQKQTYSIVTMTIK